MPSTRARASSTHCPSSNGTTRRIPKQRRESLRDIASLCERSDQKGCAKEDTCGAHAQHAAGIRRRSNVRMIVTSHAAANAVMKLKATCPEVSSEWCLHAQQLAQQRSNSRSNAATQQRSNSRSNAATRTATQQRSNSRSKLRSNAATRVATCAVELTRGHDEMTFPREVADYKGASIRQPLP